jgi:hypothetical protein
MASTADDILARFPGPVTLSPSRRKWALILLISAGFTAIGVWMVASGNTTGWFPLAFFGLCAVAAVIAMLPGAGGLKLDRDGFAITNLFRSHSYRWQETSGFAVARVSGNKMVVFDDVNAAGHAIASMNVGLVGRNAALPDTYGLGADTLAELLTFWRARAVTGR